MLEDDFFNPPKPRVVYRENPKQKFQKSIQNEKKYKDLAKKFEDLALQEKQNREEQERKFKELEEKRKIQLEKEKEKEKQKEESQVASQSASIKSEKKDNNNQENQLSNKFNLETPFSLFNKRFEELENFFNERNKNYLGFNEKDDFFKEAEERYNQLQKEFFNSKENKKSRIGISQSSSTKTYYDENGKKVTIASKTWEDSEGNRHVFTVENKDGKVLKKHEKSFLDRNGKLVTEVNEDCETQALPENEKEKKNDDIVIEEMKEKEKKI